MSDSLARALFLDGDVPERHVKVGSLPVDQDITIVGIAANATQGDPRNSRPLVLCRPTLPTPVINASNPNLLIATDDPATVAAGVTEILRVGGPRRAARVDQMKALRAE